MGCGLSKAQSNREVPVSQGGARLSVQRHQAGWQQAHIAAAIGASWIDRLAAEGEAGLATRTSRPHHADPDQ